MTATTIPPTKFLWHHPDTNQVILADPALPVPGALLLTHLGDDWQTVAPELLTDAATQGYPCEIHERLADGSRRVHQFLPLM